MRDWFLVENIDTVDTPALIVFPERVKANIAALKKMAGDPGRLRPHVKTHKMDSVSRLMLDAGITRFKCATIAEAEMLGRAAAPDVLLAYQPVGPKVDRLISLVSKYPDTCFSCLVSDRGVATELSRQAGEAGIVVPVFIDLNNGMNRSGIKVRDAWALFEHISSLEGLQLKGLQAYDGHIRIADPAARQQASDDAFGEVLKLRERIEKDLGRETELVAGGSPSLPTHVQRPRVTCSPGTFVFWDWGYDQGFPDEPFIPAALVVTRVVSIIDDETVCVDLGHKSVAAENPFPRVHFLNLPEARQVSQSEEHLVLKLEPGNMPEIGDVLYGVPMHVCPTVALYEKAITVEDGRANGEWRVTARDRSIGI